MLLAIGLLLRDGLLSSYLRCQSTDEHHMSTMVDYDKSHRNRRFQLDVESGFGTNLIVLVCNQ